MMTAPTGKIVERPMLARACGCVQEFQVYEVDRYRAQRQAKFQSTRCPACAAKVVAQQPPVLKKWEAFARLPAGTQMALTRLPDGTWAGSLAADGVTAQASAANPQGLTIALAHAWLAARAPRPPA
jgi:hypothetical protein